MDNLVGGRNQKIILVFIILLTIGIILPAVQAQEIALDYNHPPLLDPIGNKTIIVGSLLNFTIHASDPELQTITYSYSPLLFGATLNSSSGEFRWTPTKQQIGNHNVTFSASDSEKSATEEITISVYKQLPFDECTATVQVEALVETTTFGAGENACCLINQSGVYDSSDCPPLSSCGEKYGIRITASDVLFNGGGVHIVSSKNACCAGIEVNDPQGYLHDVIIRNVAVHNWHTGIMFTDVDQGEINGTMVSDTQNGIYLSNASRINIFSNIITDNSVFGLRVANFGLGASNDVIYNNYFRNLYNVGPDASFRPHQWNVSIRPGQNIIDGPYIGGNYWANLSGTGHSEICECKSNGFCTETYMVRDSNNVDYLPLCIYTQPEFYINVEKIPGNWNLDPRLTGGLNIRHDAILLEVLTEAKWEVRITSVPNDGKLTTPSSPIYKLSNLLQIEKKSPPYSTAVNSGDIIDFEYTLPHSNYYSTTLDLMQEVEWWDRPAPLYNITLVFTGTPIVE